MRIVIDTGNHIAALAAKLAKPDVVAAYPITPQTTIVEKIAEYVERREFHGDYICVESEHSAMSACIGASSAGARTFTATSSHGLLLMHEMLHWAALARLPIVMVNVNRAVGPGWNIWSDQNDSMAQRDTGWIQVYCSSNQEILDSVIQAFRIGEHRDVQLPVMVCYDGFILSHTSMPVKVPEEKDIDEFLPKREPQWLLDPENPVTHGNIIMPKDYPRIRRAMQDAHENAKRLIPEISREWRERFGTYHGDLIERYRCDDADYIIVSYAALGAESKVAVDELREEGKRVGLARLRFFRPFPSEDILSLSKQSDLIVIDRAISIGFEGPLFTEIKSTLYGVSDARVYGYIAGLGGKDVTYKDIGKMVKKVMDGRWKGVEWYDMEG
ncbi:MAG TPA: pyruvate ferredoxin oxidoreductase [Thermoplasmatales archaeon]|nr:pyruvate ferredoxin oxidoreductase [Thermoplasmatales archaeon]HEX17566.1 pyruvate ferredoxin oxidoreductase [Thermoplasmatales archaeon]